MSTHAPVEVGVEPTGSMKRTGEFVCQVGPAVAASLGLGGGGLVVVERDVADHGVLTAIGRLQVEAAVAADVARLDQRALEGQTAPVPARVVAAAPMLGQQQDIRWIRLDQQARGELNVALSLASVRIRRDVRRRVVDGLRDAGIAFFLSQFAVLSLIDVHGLARAAVVGLLAVLAVGYVVWKIRSELP